jgi:Flp pilus assembly protein TadG
MKIKELFSLPGQIVVLFAVVLVALLGFTALAVDGAVIYSDKRAAQNGADAASLAGAGMAAQYWENHQVRYDTFACNNGTVIAGMNQGITDAINRAATNNYTIENNLSHQNGVQVSCHVEDIGPYLDEYIDVKVMITVQSNTSFAQLFYNGPVGSVVTSIARVHPRTNLGFGYAVASMGNDCTTGGVHGNGNTSIHSTNGGVFSNSCFDFTNAHTHIYVNDPDGSGCRYYNGSVNSSWCDVPIVKSPVRIVPAVIPEPKCDELPTYGSAGGHGTFTLSQGNYTTISMNGNSSMTLNPGLYCISGGLSIGANQVLVGHGVTLFFTNNAGYTSGATSQVDLTAPTLDHPYAMRGLLMYAEPGNTGTFVLYGGAVSNYQGTVYIPSGSIDAHGGGGANAFNSQFVGKKVTLEGTSDLNIEFDGAYNYQVPATVDLQQ